MRKNPSILYFTLGTFLLSYVLWGIIIIGQQMGVFAPGSMWFTLLHVIGGNSPAIFAYLSIRRANPGYTFKEYLKSVFTFKQKPLYYLFVVAMVALNFIAPAIIGGLSTEPVVALESMGFSGHMPLYLAIILIPLFFFGGGSEELGWRGIMQPELENKFHVIPATMITAAFWTLWHLPLWFIAGTGQGEINFGLFFVSVAGLSFALAVVRRITGSVWMCVLFHCAINSLQGSLPIIDNTVNKIVICAVYIVVSISILFWHEKKAKAVEA